MAIKKISFNKEGLVSEEELDRPMAKPVTPEKTKKKYSEKVEEVFGRRL